MSQFIFFFLFNNICYSVANLVAYFSLPEEYVLKPLNESEVEYVDRVWPNQHVGSAFLLKRFARLNPNVGIFTKDKKLVAWSLRFV